MRVVPLAATAVGVALTAGAAFAIDSAPSSLGVHHAAFVVPADIADGSGSDGSGGCPAGSGCMRPPGVPLTAGATSSGDASSNNTPANNTPALPVPGTDPDEIASHQAKSGSGDLGANSAIAPPDPEAPVTSPPDQNPMPLSTPAGTGSAGNTTGGTSASSPAGGENVSPNQAMELVAAILGAVSKLITGLFG